MNEELIEALETLTESVRNLNGNIEYLQKCLTTTDGKFDNLSDKLEESTKAVQKLTTEVNRNTFK